MLHDKRVASHDHSDIASNQVQPAPHQHDTQQFFYQLRVYDQSNQNGMYKNSNQKTQKINAFNNRPLADIQDPSPTRWHISLHHSDLPASTRTRRRNGPPIVPPILHHTPLIPSPNSGPPWTTESALVVFADGSSSRWYPLPRSHSPCSQRRSEEVPT
ncbi:hypothetical protein OG21DRAFT_1514946 [Imleria badia]|nr:hypothetical protein OG21DRAFT_1514946 [Imleria badia]